MASVHDLPDPTSPGPSELFLRTSPLPSPSALLWPPSLSALLLSASVLAVPSTQNVLLPSKFSCLLQVLYFPVTF